jgi:hypothetical protein
MCGRGGWFVATLLFAALLLLPGPQRSAFSGAPLSTAGYLLLGGAAAAFALGILVRPARRVPPGLLAVLALLAVLKPLGAGITPVAGWRGEYYADADPTARQSFKAGAFTRDHRVDRSIDFEGARLKLHFVNDPVRYATPHSPEPRDRKFPLAIEWSGHAWLERGTVLRIETASRGRLAVDVDGMEAIAAGAETPRTTRPEKAVVEIPVRAGLRHFRVSYRKPAYTDPLVSVRVTSGGREVPIAPAISGARGGGRHAWMALATTAGILAAALLLAGLAAWCFPPRALLASPGPAAVAVVAGLVVLAGTVQMVVPVRDATVSLSSGDDWLAYEGYARNVLFQGVLMPNGAAPGHGVPYYHYPLYSYALAAAHVVLGEEFSAVTFFNVLAVASVGLLCWFLAWRHLGTRAALTGVAAVGVFTLYHLLPYARTAFSDNLFVPLVLAALLLCDRALARDRAHWWVAAGIATAAAAATRPSFLTHAGIWPAAVLLLGAGAWRHRAIRVGAFWAGCLIGLAPFAARNWIMARRAVLLVDSWIQIPYFLYPRNEPKPAMTVRTLGEGLELAWQFTLARPWTVVEIEARKIGFSLGLTELGPRHVGSHPLLLAGFLLFLAALWLRRLPPRLALVLGAFAVSHLAAMVIAAPWTYGYKTILPLHVAFLVGGLHVLRGGVAAAAPIEPAGSGGG